MVSDVSMGVAMLILSVFLILVLWPTLIKRHGGRVSDTLDVSSLSKISDGYTPGHMITTVKSVLTERRIQQVGNLEFALIP